jgi:hypothetical protein
MSVKCTSLTIVLLMSFFACASGAEDAPKIRGTVVDGEGRPVAKAEVSPSWSPNDWYDANGKLRDVKNPVENKKLWSNTGRMRPLPTYGVATTDNLGHFVLALPDLQWENCIVAYDASRKRGGIAALHGDNENSELVIHLQPLVHLHGKLRLAETGAVPDWLIFYAYLPPDERKPLAGREAAMCGSLDGNVSFMLPPGEYDLEAHTDPDSPGGSKVLKPEQLKVRLTETKLDYDLGTLRLYPHISCSAKTADAKQRGERGDYAKLFGKPLPPWHVVVARGISVDTKPGDLKGKWTLIYFFNFGCAHCLATGLPEAAQFYELNRDKRAQFEIIGFCADYSGELSTLELLERKLQPIVKNVWKGKDLPFPLLLDNSLTTYNTYGLPSFGPILIDPQGNLVKGELKELAEKIGAKMPAP